MTDWKLVSELVSPAVPKKRRKTAKSSEAKKDWRQDPATEKQIEFLKSFGVTPAPNLKKGEASELIDRCINDPEARRIQDEKRFADWEAVMKRQRQERAASGAFSFRKDFEKAKTEVAKEMDRISKSKVAAASKKKELALLQKRLTHAVGAEKEEIEEQIEDIECDLIDLECDPIDLQCCKEELKEAETVRIKFWKATFKRDWIQSDDAMEYDVLVDVSTTIDKLYEEYGQYFKSPTNKQIKDVLESLDSASLDWDRAQPDAFFARLHHISPSQMKVGAGIRTSKSSTSRTKAGKGKGCLVVLLSGVLLFVTMVVVLAYIADQASPRNDGSRMVG
ncbi:hypothetical protein DES53_107269 [Roseimicrobium gellanilyticum]|uniref:Uncharacterized protein n=2 Tax=Roseimicrobium gellanilyticum TaxID=748857 RepID=A0A366HFY0_9BACT|nr:hypothetical protein DES53_107269 [Roseimicrobium gellanilyticum]